MVQSFLGQNPNGTHALSGTPGIGKSRIVMYLCIRILQVVAEKQDIVYQQSDVFFRYCRNGDVFMLKNGPSVMDLITKSSTFYIIDGNMAKPLLSTCLTFFVSSPRNDKFQNWCKQQKTTPLYLPVWTLEELETCHPECYPDLSSKDLHSRFRRYGGIARTVFWTMGDVPSIDAAVNESNARKSINSVGIPSKMFPTSHMLLHIIVNSNLGFQELDIASDYIGVLLLEKYFDETMEKLKSLIGDRGALGGHLFECYMHFIFQHSDKLEFLHRSLEGSVYGSSLLEHCLT